MSCVYAISKPDCNNYSANGKFTVMYLTDGSAVILLDTDAEPIFPIGGHSRTHTWCLAWKKVANEINLEANTLQVPISVCNIGPQIQYSIVQGFLSGRKSNLKASL